jgi:hypothetical protein
MRTRIFGEDGTGEGERRDELRVFRRQLLLGAGAATLGAACGPAGDFDSEEPIESVELPLPNYTGVPSWSWTTISNFYTFVRDVRWLRMDGGGSFNRRISWLYPDGGCEARAQIICHRAQISLLATPYKAYVAGLLRFTTNNAAPGWSSVTWGFHIAPIVKSSGTGNIWVIDPSISTAGPLTMTSWLSRINGGINGVVVNPPSFYGPGSGNNDDCWDEMEGEYLRLEWDRQVALGRDPRQVLGDNPPW